MRCLRWALCALLGLVDASVPELAVPHCSNGWGVVDQYYLIQGDGLKPPLERSRAAICWNESGISVTANHTDNDIWQECEACGCPNYAHGDVGELFIAPVSSLDLSPSWYYELDTGALTAAFWGGIVHNTLGDDSLYPAATPCAVAPAPGSFDSCPMDCSGTLPSVSVASGPGWWSHNLLAPWSLFEERFAPGPSGAPWPHWRANFYRYAFPFRLPDGSFDHQTPELSAWSPTHSSTFHVPGQFGRLRFVARSGAGDADGAAAGAGDVLEV